MGWLRTCVPRCHRGERRFLRLAAADVRGRGRPSRALLPPDVMQLLTSLRSGANGGVLSRRRGAERWAGIQLHNGRGGPLPCQRLPAREQLSTKQGGIDFRFSASLLLLLFHSPPFISYRGWTQISTPWERASSGTIARTVRLNRIS